jgi:tetratricopeptide (TPR) repeat protein
MRYEEYFEVSVNAEAGDVVEGGISPKENLNAFVFECKKLSQSEQFNYAGSQNFPINDNYSFSIKEESFKVTNVKTLKALIGFLVSVREIDLGFELIDAVEERFEPQFINLQRARLYLAKGELEKADSYLPKKLNNYDKCFISAQVKEGLGQIEEAILIYEKSIQYKIVPEVYFKIGQLSLRSGKKSKGIQNMLLAHKLNYKNKMFAKAIGAYYYNEGDYKSSIDFFSMLKKDPQIEKYLGISLLMIGEKEKAKKKFKKLLKRFQDDEIAAVVDKLTKQSNTLDLAEHFKDSLTIDV